MNTREYIESGILEAYALGALSAEEAERVAADVAQSPDLQNELREIEMALERYNSAMAIAPPVGLQDKIWDAIEQGSTAQKAGNEKEQRKTATKIPLQPDYKRPMQWRYAAVWIVLAGSVIMNFFLWNQNKEDVKVQTAMNDQLTKVQGQQLEQGQLLSSYQKEKNMMSDTGMETIVMHTVQKGHPMAATVYWSKNKGEAYVAIDGLPEPPKGMQYQLWAIQDGKPVNMGMLPNSMANTPAIQRVEKPVMASEAFAISLEKEGGSPSPTMQNIYVMGKA